VNIFYSCAQNGYNQKWDCGLDHTYPFLFDSVPELFISGLPYSPHVTGETDHRKRNFSKTHFRVEVFENAGFSFTCGRTKTEVIRLRWRCHTPGTDLCRLHIALRMLRKGCYHIFIVLAFLCENYVNTLQVDVYYYFEKGEKMGLSVRTCPFAFKPYRWRIQNHWYPYTLFHWCQLLIYCSCQVTVYSLC